MHSLEQATAAMETPPIPGLAVPAQAGVTALTALLREIAAVSHGARKKVMSWINTT